MSVCMRCSRQHCTAVDCGQACTECGSPAGSPHTAVCSILGILDAQQNTLTESARALQENDNDPEPETGESTRPRHTDLQSELVALAAVEHVQRRTTAAVTRATSEAPAAPDAGRAMSDSTQTTSCATPATGGGATESAGHLSAEEIAYCYSITVSPVQDHGDPH